MPSLSLRAGWRDGGELSGSWPVPPPRLASADAAEGWRGTNLRLRAGCIAGPRLGGEGCSPREGAAVCRTSRPPAGYASLAIITAGPAPFPWQWSDSCTRGCYGIKTLWEPGRWACPTSSDDGHQRLSSAGQRVVRLRAVAVMESGRVRPSRQAVEVFGVSERSAGAWWRRYRVGRRPVLAVKARTGPGGSVRTAAPCCSRRWRTTRLRICCSAVRCGPASWSVG